jgi:glycosyltransferase involved in cell wall biosynthesis
MNRNLTIAPPVQRPSIDSAVTGLDGSYAGPVGAPGKFTSQRPLHVVFVADAYTDPTNIRAWSGTPYFAKQALKRQGVRVTVLRLDERSALIGRWANFLWYKFVFRKRYLRDRHTPLLQSYGRQIREQVMELQPDFVFSMATGIIAYLETDRPIAFWVDACFSGMEGFYASFADLAPVSVQEANEADRSALCRSALAIYSSEWAAESARNGYPVEPQRVHVVNLGANLETTPSATEIANLISLRERETCRLLLVGVDWERKGVDTAIAIAAVMQAAEIPVRLTIIGCLPPEGTTVPDFVELVGFLSKQTDEGQRRIAQYFRESHFLVLPTRAEAYGMVFCEACAFALPSIAPRVGGIPSIIEHGVTGWLLPPDAEPADYAELLIGKWKDQAQYEAMALDCHRVYLERLNWDSAASRVVSLMRRCLDEDVKPSPSVSP